MNSVSKKKYLITCNSFKRNIVENYIMIYSYLPGDESRKLGTSTIPFSWKNIFIRKLNPFVKIYFNQGNN